MWKALCYTFLVGMGSAWAQNDSLGLYEQYAVAVETDTMQVRLPARALRQLDPMHPGDFTNASIRKVDFAGKYSTATWGCGTECQTGVIINAITGQITPLPTASWGYQYKKDSRLLIVNPVEDFSENVNERPQHAKPRVYIWNDTAFVQIRIPKKNKKSRP